MKLKIFTVYDSKVEAFLRPFFMQSKGEAIRAFEDTCQDQKSQLNKHPEDFTLFEIGEYDDSNAGIITHQAKIALGTALEHIKKSDYSNISPISAE